MQHSCQSLCSLSRVECYQQTVLAGAFLVHTARRCSTAAIASYHDTCLLILMIAMRGWNSLGMYGFQSVKPANAATQWFIAKNAPNNPPIGKQRNLFHSANVTFHTVRIHCTNASTYKACSGEIGKGAAGLGHEDKEDR